MMCRARNISTLGTGPLILCMVTCRHLYHKYRYIGRSCNAPIWARWLFATIIHGTLSNTIFDYIFWAFAPTIQVFGHLKPIIYVNGTFLKRHCHEKLPITIRFYACNHMFPLSFTLVDGESNRN